MTSTLFSGSLKSALGLTREMVVVTQGVSSLFDAETERSGGALCFFGHDGSWHQIAVIGNPGVDEKRFMDNAFNKCSAMFETDEKTSSFPIANPEAIPPVYPGGIRLSTGDFLAFSGYPPLWDEALCIALARRFNLITELQMGVIVCLSRNLYFHRAEALFAQAA
ncbi:MAG: hypothetical protein ACI92I_000013 [Acidimicrobiales bacterium]|jgi:hypothetical protein